jgi:hypothetical protein
VNITTGKVFDYKLEEPQTVRKQRLMPISIIKPPLPKTLKRMYVTREDIQAELQKMKKAGAVKQMSVQKDER